jgi:hypothetical protein
LAVTTALCADQVSASAPALRPQTASLAGRIVSRLTQSFGRTVADASQVQPRNQALARPAADRATVTWVPLQVATHQPLSPFQFRLPPPAL